MDSCFFRWCVVRERRKTSGSVIMYSRQLLSTVVALWLVGLTPAIADDVRFFERDGITYRETRRTVQRPVSETRLEQVERTVYRWQRSSETHQSTRTWCSPTTEYRCEPYLVGRWNPFVRPYFAYHYVPCTRWEQKTEVVDVPVTCCRLVPETRKVDVPVTTRRMVSEEVISRVAVSGVGSSPLQPIPQSNALARGERIGGIARLTNDPPRYGIR